MGKRIGLFGGTFDPIHLGHLNLAFEVLEKAPLDEVWFCPAKKSPFKENEGIASPKERGEMVKLAIQDIPQFHFLDSEIQRLGPSYTFDTVKELVNSSNHFSLILGSDSVPSFHKWHKAADIVRLVPLLIGTRQGTDFSLEEGNEIDEAIKKGLLQTSAVDISATEIRNRLKLGLCCQHLLPKEVLDYIKKHHLYSDTV